MQLLGRARGRWWFWIQCVGHWGRGAGGLQRGWPGRRPLEQPGWGSGVVGGRPLGQPASWRALAPRLLSQRIVLCTSHLLASFSFCPLPHLPPCLNSSQTSPALGLSKGRAEGWAGGAWSCVGAGREVGVEEGREPWQPPPHLRLHVLRHTPVLLGRTALREGPHCWVDGVGELGLRGQEEGVQSLLSIPKGGGG